MKTLVLKSVLLLLRQSSKYFRMSKGRELRPFLVQFVFLVDYSLLVRLHFNSLSVAPCFQRVTANTSFHQDAGHNPLVKRGTVLAGGH